MKATLFLVPDYFIQFRIASKKSSLTENNPSKKFFWGGIRTTVTRRFSDKAFLKFEKNGSYIKI